MTKPQQQVFLIVVLQLSLHDFLECFDDDDYYILDVCVCSVPEVDGPMKGPLAFAKDTQQMSIVSSLVYYSLRLVGPAGRYCNKVLIITLVSAGFE